MIASQHCIVVDLPGLWGWIGWIAASLPCAARSLASAAERLNESFCMTMAVLTEPACSSRCAAVGWSTPVAAAMMPSLGAVDELGVGGLYVDHEVAVDGSGFDRDAGAQHVEDELGGGSGFEARAAGEDFGAGNGGDGDVGDGGHLRVGDAGEGDGEGTDRAGVGECAEDVGVRPAAMPTRVSGVRCLLR